ncbi:MAG: S9 family peptidase [Fusobacterium necrophorum]|nr:S9 family peptidase [Fusobacterium necrophorum]
MKKIEIKTFLEYSFLSNVRFSKNGKYISYTKTKANLEKNDYEHYVYVYDTQSKENKEYTSLGKEKNVVWLDDTRLLFQTSRDSNIKEKKKEGEEWTEYYSIDVRGGEAKAFLQLPYSVTDIQACSSGFVFTANYSNADISLHGLTGEERAKAIEKKKEEADYEVLDEIPFWSNGLGFTNKQRNRLYLYETASQKIEALTPEFMNVEYFKVSENRVLFIAEEYHDKLEQTNALYEYDLLENRCSCLIEDGNYNFSFADYMGRDIVCAASDMKSFGINENHKLYFVKNGTLELFYENDTWLLSTVGSDCKFGGGKTFHTTDNALYFLSTLEDFSVINCLHRDGRLELLTARDGSVDFFDIYKDTLVYGAMKDYGLQELYLKENTEEIEITKHNRTVFEEYSVSKPEKIFMESYGESIEIYVIKPVGFEEGKEYPAILDIHGGPKTVYGNVFYHEMQVWANLGYFVFFTNPHGSDGRGNRFMDIRGKYGSIDYEDLMKATDIVLESYPIDRKRVGVTGGSYGGFMTNWIIGHTDRFACAVSQRSISNWISKFGTTDIGYYFNADQNQSTPWNKVEKLWSHSPLKYANQVKTPTLFIHSEEDYRCWLAEGLQMFTALKYHGVEARLCMFRGENHELSRSGKPKHRVRRLEEITNWFERYLKKQERE